MRSVAEGGIRRMWGRELTPKREKEAWDSSNSMSKKNSRDFLSGLLDMNEEDTRENSDLRVRRESSGFEWSLWASKKTRKWNGRGVGRERMRRSRASERWMTPVEDWDRRAESSETMESDKGVEACGVREERRQSRRRTAVPSFGRIAIGGGGYGVLVSSDFDPNFDVFIL